jgi:uncharacterized membrane protein
MEEVDKMKKIIKNTIKICIFISLASLPFITMTQIIGMNIFLDSFENPDCYICLQDNDNSLGLKENIGDYIIIQRSSHPEFEVENTDFVLYYDFNGELTCNKVDSISAINSINRYKITDELIYPQQIVGKVINVIDDNIWNSISITIWDTSINSLNLRALT